MPQHKAKPATTLSARDTAGVLLDVVLPLFAQGLIARRPRVVVLAERLDADRRAIDRIGTLRQRCGPGPVLLRLPARDVALVLSPSDVQRVLVDEAELFAPANREKRAALSHFQPEGVLISEGAERATRPRRGSGHHGGRAARRRIELGYLRAGLVAAGEARGARRPRSQRRARHRGAHEVAPRRELGLSQAKAPYPSRTAAHGARRAPRGRRAGQPGGPDRPGPELRRDRGRRPGRALALRFRRGRDGGVPHTGPPRRAPLLPTAGPRRPFAAARGRPRIATPLADHPGPSSRRDRGDRLGERHTPAGKRRRHLRAVFPPRSRAPSLCRLLLPRDLARRSRTGRPCAHSVQRWPGRLSRPEPRPAADEFDTRRPHRA